MNWSKGMLPLNASITQFVRCVPPHRAFTVALVAAWCRRSAPRSASEPPFAHRNRGDASKSINDPFKGVGVIRRSRSWQARHVLEAGRSDRVWLAAKESASRPEATESALRDAKCRR